jgi:hypothetical protein
VDWNERLETVPDQPVRFEVEFWYRNIRAFRERAEGRLRTELERAGGQIIDRTDIEAVRYHAALVEVRPEFVRSIIGHPNVGLAAFDEIMVLRPQSLVTEFVDIESEETFEGTDAPLVDAAAPVAALLDGLPMASHDKLRNRLVIDDPDGFEGNYGRAGEQRHGTAMASLILHGDLNNPNTPVGRRLYVRPVMFPQLTGFGERQEYMPLDRLGVDLMWRAFFRMFESENGNAPAAPTVKIVNLSLGDAKRRFAGVMSPWARLLDALAWQYGLLILVSAGNITDELSLPSATAWSAVEAMEPQLRQAGILRSILDNRSTRKLLSPSEAINVLTVGASHADNIQPQGSGVMALDPYVSSGLPNPSSALGLGFRRGVKPELLMPGGREHVQSRSSHSPINVRPVATPGRDFGIGVACPDVTGRPDRRGNLSGTSVATALATNAALRILEALEDIPSDEVHPPVDPNFHAVILKALLVHATRWDDLAADSLKPLVNQPRKLYWEHERDEISRFLGFGCPDIDRVLDCSEERATLIGWGHIRAREEDVYRIPLPAALQGIVGFRAVTTTVAWLTPLSLSHRMYRMAKIEVGPGEDKKFSLAIAPAKSQPSDNAAARGTVFHRRWEGESAATFVDGGDLVLKVSCKPTAGELDQEIPYGLAVSLEVGQGVAVPVYDEIKQRLDVIRQRSRPRPRVRT